MTRQHLGPTVHQVLTRYGRRAVMKTCGVKYDVLRKWYKTGIPPKHWRTLVKSADWITYQLLEQVNDNARKGIRRIA